jgi:hypothetical protein
MASLDEFPVSAVEAGALVELDLARVRDPPDASRRVVVEYEQVDTGRRSTVESRCHSASLAR